MIVNNTLSVGIHFSVISTFLLGSNWQKRISWESWARGSKGRYRRPQDIVLFLSGKNILLVQKNDGKFVPAGRAWSHRKYWIHRREGKTPRHRRLLCSEIPAYSSFQHCVSVFQGLVGFFGPVGESGIPGEKVKRATFYIFIFNFLTR